MALGAASGPSDLVKSRISPEHSAPASTPAAPSASPHRTSSMPQGMPSARAPMAMSSMSGPPRGASLSKLQGMGRSEQMSTVANQALDLAQHMPRGTGSAAYQRLMTPNTGANATAVRADVGAAHTALAGAAPEQQAELQMAGHQALRSYTTEGHSKTDSAKAMLHNAGQGAVKGTKESFGGAHKTGIDVIDHTPLGQTGMGKVSDAAGKLIGKKGSEAVANQVKEQKVAADASVVVPDRMVELMNQMEPGSGTALREKAQKRQDDAAHSSNNGDSLAGKAMTKGLSVGAERLGAGAAGAAAGTAATTALVAAGVGTGGAAFVAAGVTAAVGFGVKTGINAAVGAFRGVGKGAHEDLSSMKVPNMEALEKAHQEGTPLGEVPREAVNLFYTQAAEPTPPPSSMPATTPAA
jgi:hypothetical protein